MNSVDIAIVGAGLVGTPLAQVLSQQGWSVALLDAAGPSSRAESDNNNVTGLGGEGRAEKNSASLAQRCTALSLGTSQWLNSKGLWADIAADACAISQVHVSHKGYFGSTRLCAAELNADAVGYVVNNDTLTSTLQRQIKCTDVQLVNHARVNGVTCHGETVSVHYADNGSHELNGSHQLQTKLLVAADGVSSVIRKSAGIDTRQIDYDQLAVLGTLELGTAHHHVAYERFTPSGPLAFLPRPGPFMSFVDCIEPHERETVMMMGSDEYLQRLQHRFGHRLGRFKAVGPRMVTPLVRIEACEQIAERTVLLGNAMRLLHPVGGQGYNLAMRDVAELAGLLQQNRDNDPGNASLLSQFVDNRRKDQDQVVMFTDVLARGFRGKASLPAHVRALGLISLDAVSPLRQAFARRTMGLS